MENTDNWSCKWNPISNKCEGEPQASPIRQQSRRRFKGRIHFRDIRSRVLATKQGKSGSNRWQESGFPFDNPQPPPAPPKPPKKPRRKKIRTRTIPSKDARQI